MLEEEARSCCYFTLIILWLRGDIDDFMTILHTSNPENEQCVYVTFT